MTLKRKARAGRHLVTCSICLRVVYDNEATLNWQGRVVCMKDVDIPPKFKPERQKKPHVPPLLQPEPEDQFQEVNDPSGQITD